MDVLWRIELLGWLRAVSEERVLTRFRTQKTAALLAYLAYYRQRAHPREVLIEILWPECHPALGRQSLRKALSSLRHQLEPPGVPPGSVLVADRHSVQLNPALCTSDVALFEGAVQAAMREHSAERARYLTDAAGLYAGELLPGFYLDWILLERERLAEMHARVLRQMTALREEAGPSVARAAPSDGAVSTAAAEVPVTRAGRLPLQITRFFGRTDELARLSELLLDESLAPCRLLTVTGPGGVGKTRLALEFARRLREAELPGCGRSSIDLPAVWFVPLLDLSDPELILDKVIDALRLPRSPQMEPLEQIAAFLSRQPTLLILDNFEQLVEGGAECVQALLQQVDTLSILVTSRRCLDLPGERELALAPLPVPSVGGSGTGGDGAQQPDTLVTCPSVQLFLDRAQAARPDFQLMATNAGAIASLCATLEGLPLALELAAARIQVLTPTQMLARMAGTRAADGRFELLVGRQRQPDARHRSLRTTLDWSYQLLCTELQRFFALLSVFRGGWTLEAAERICEEPRALEYLEELRSGSLVIAEGSEDEVRFRMLESLREYAADQLSPEEQEAAARRHMAYFRRLVEQAEEEWTSPAQAEWFACLDRECDNLRAALTWSQTKRGDWEQGLRMGQALYWFWHSRSYEREGLTHLSELLARAGESRTATRARAQAVAGFMALMSGEVEAATALSQESLDMGRELGDNLSIAFSLRNLGQAALNRSDYAGACGLFTEGRATWEGLGNKWGVAMSLDRLADIASRQGDLVAAHRLAEQSLALRRELGDEQGVAVELDKLGKVARLRGELETARLLCEEALAIRRKLGIRHPAAISLTQLCLLAHARGDDSTARALMEESLTICRELGSHLWMSEARIQLASVALGLGDGEAARTILVESLASARKTGDARCVARSLHYLAEIARSQDHWEEAAALYGESLAIQRDVHPQHDIPASLEGLAVVAGGLGQDRRAVRLLGAAHSLRAALGVPVLPRQQPELEEHLSALRVVLGDAAFAAAWDAGQKLTWEQAVDEALEEADDALPHASASRGARQAG